MRVLKCAVFWLVLILFAVLVLWWSVYFPYDRMLLYRAVPPHALLISEHRELAGRWTAFARNPAVRSVLMSMGVPAKDLNSIVSDPTTQRLLDKYGSRNVVVTYVPYLGLTREPAWVVTSWAGCGSAQFLRWWLTMGWVKDFEKVEPPEGGHRTQAGRAHWVLKSRSLNSANRLSLSVVDGLVVGCLSKDPDAVREIVRRIERRAPFSPELRRQFTRVGARAEDSGDLDRGWIRGLRRASGELETYSLSYALTSYDESGMAGWVRGNIGMPPAKPLNRSPADALVTRFMGDAPDAALVVPLAYLVHFGSGPDAPASLRLAVEGLQSVAAPDASVLVALLGGDYSGRILGLKVPSIVLAAQVPDSGAATERVCRTLDALNSEHGWGLIPRRVEVNGWPVTVLDSSRAGIYSALGPKDKPGFMVEGEWLIMASNAGVLTRLASETSAPRPAGRWRKELNSEDALAFLWVDFPPAGKALRHAVAVYSLVLMAQQSEGSRHMRKTLEDVNAWIDAVGPLRTGVVWLASETDDSRFRADFRLGGVTTARQPL